VADQRRSRIHRGTCGAGDDRHRGTRRRPGRSRHGRRRTAGGGHAAREGLGARRRPARAGPRRPRGDRRRAPGGAQAGRPSPWRGPPAATGRTWALWPSSSTGSPRPGDPTVPLLLPTAGYGDPGVDLITQDTPCAPVNPYGESKPAGEWPVRAAGAGARHRDDLPALLQRGRGGGAGTGRQRRLRHGPDGLRPAHPWRGPADLRRRWRRPGDAPRAVASAELAAGELGFRARRDVRETVGPAWRGRRSHHV
jgi:hypothetical protein